jgi:surface antigen
MEQFNFNIKNLNYVPIGGCKIYYKKLQNGGTVNGRACKQADGSWKVE